MSGALLNCLTTEDCNIMRITLYLLYIGGFFALDHKPHRFHQLSVFTAGGNDINACCLNGRVPENVGKFGNILLDAIEHPRKQMPQIMRKHLFGIHLCFKAEVFHFPPDIRSTHRFARACDEDCSCRYLLLRYIANQFLLQITDYENASRLALERDCRFAFSDGFHGDEL